jgi:hypothetical protein
LPECSSSMDTHLCSALHDAQPEIRLIHKAWLLVPKEFFLNPGRDQELK